MVQVVRFRIWDLPDIGIAVGRGRSQHRPAWRPGYLTQGLDLGFSVHVERSGLRAWSRGYRIWGLGLVF